MLGEPPENQQEEQVNGWLVQKVNEERVPSDGCEKPWAALAFPFGAGKAAEEIARQEQKKPGEEGKIIRGEKSGGGKSQESR